MLSAFSLSSLLRYPVPPIGGVVFGNLPSRSLSRYLRSRPTNSATILRVCSFDLRRVLPLSSRACMFPSRIQTGLVPQSFELLHILSGTLVCATLPWKRVISKQHFSGHHISLYVCPILQGPIHCSLNHLAMPRSYTFLDIAVQELSFTIPSSDLIIFADIPPVYSAIPDVRLFITCFFHITVPHSRSDGVAFHFLLTSNIHCFGQLWCRLYNSSADSFHLSFTSLSLSLLRHCFLKIPHFVL